MNLAYKYPIIFWNCACLITDSGGADIEEEIDEEGNAQEIIWSETEMVSMEDFTDDDDGDESEEEEDLEKTIDKKKKKNRNANFGRKK